MGVILRFAFVLFCTFLVFHCIFCSFGSAFTTPWASTAASPIVPAEFWLVPVPMPVPIPVPMPVPVPVPVPVPAFRPEQAKSTAAIQMSFHHSRIADAWRCGKSRYKVATLTSSLTFILFPLFSLAIQRENPQVHPSSQKSVQLETPPCTARALRPIAQPPDCIKNAAMQPSCVAAIVVFFCAMRMASSIYILLCRIQSGCLGLLLLFLLPAFSALSEQHYFMFLGIFLPLFFFLQNHLKKKLKKILKKIPRKDCIGDDGAQATSHVPLAAEPPFSERRAGRYLIARDCSLISRSSATSIICRMWSTPS